MSNQKNNYRWKRIPGYRKYAVSCVGKICEIKTKKIIHQRERTGYMRVNLIDDMGNKKWAGVHKIIALSWIPNPEGKQYVNHKNMNKKDNRVENLEWCTQKENCGHSIKNGKKISHEIPVSMHGLDGKLIEKFDSMGDALKYVNRILEKEGKPVLKSHHSISKVCTGKNKSGGGYVWKYINDQRIIIPDDAIIVKNYTDYKVDPRGIIYRINKNKPIKPQCNLDGRYYVTLNKMKKNNNTISPYIHNIVAEAFLPNPLKYTCVKHKDGNYSNNNVSNLEWIKGNWKK
jgi:HNH endonuclease/NUMOD4 motif